MTPQPEQHADIRRRLGLRPIIKVSGIMMALGASIVVPDAPRAVTEILPEFVAIGDLQREASADIARLTGGVAGFVTASASAGMRVGVAGGMTGPGLGRFERLPDATGMKDEVVVQAGHRIGYGAVETRHLELWYSRLSGQPGVSVSIVPDPTDNPLDRLRLGVDPAAARITACELADVLAAGDPPVIVRDHEVEHGHFFLHPCNLHGGEAAVVADRILAELAPARDRAGSVSAAEGRVRGFERLLRWPD